MESAIQKTALYFLIYSTPIPRPVSILCPFSNIIKQFLTLYILKDIIPTHESDRTTRNTSLSSTKCVTMAKMKPNPMIPAAITVIMT